MKRRNRFMIPALALLLVAAEVQARAPSGVEHIHDIAADGSGALLLATHRGVLRLHPNGSSEPVSERGDDFMAFQAIPGRPGHFVGSGHPPDGGNLGLIRSTDGGRQWEHVSDGLDGPVDYHLLTVSPADPGRLYGDYHGLQVSDDGGRSWRKSGALPPNTFTLKASVLSADTLYAASEVGLMRSLDAGQTWQPLSMRQLPATTLAIAADGTVYAFVVGQGFARGSERDPRFETLANPFGTRVLLRLVIDPREPNRLYGLDNAGSLWQSPDGGRSWGYFLERPRALTETELRGQTLFGTYCASCHGAEANGETWTPERLSNRDYLAAPPLDGTAHAWHHTDDALVDTIRNGLPRQSRMPAWKDRLSERDARDLVAFFKSYWGERELECQGPRHMQCM